jgi:hypothetical protein
MMSVTTESEQCNHQSNTISVTIDDVASVTIDDVTDATSNVYKHITTKLMGISDQKAFPRSLETVGVPQQYKRTRVIIPAGTFVCPEDRSTKPCSSSPPVVPTGGVPTIVTPPINVDANTAKVATVVPANVGIIVPDPNTYYIKLLEEIEIEIDTIITVEVNGVPFNIVDKQIHDPFKYGTTRSLRARRRFQSFVVPKKTSYVVSDPIRDMVGVGLTMKTNQRVVIMPGSTVYLTEGANAILNETIETPNPHEENIVLPNDVLMVFKNKTKCTI